MNQQEILDFIKNQIQNEFFNRIELTEPEMFRLVDFLEDLQNDIFVMTEEKKDGNDDDELELVVNKKYISHFRIGLGQLCPKEYFEDSRLEEKSKARKSKEFEDFKYYLAQEFLYQNL